MKQGNVYKWAFIDRVSIAVINLGVNLIFARLLSPDDFGLLAMIAIFIAVAIDLSSCGMLEGLIHKARPTETDYSTVFIFNSVFGLVFGMAFFFGAQAVADFFGHQELREIMRVLGVCFFFQSMSYVQETRLRKQLKMKTVCFVRVGATITVSILGIIAAASGYGYRALVCTQILLSFFFFAYYTIASRWFPKIRFSVRAFKEFFSYGVHLMLAYMATLIGKNINTFVLGRFYPPAFSGIYYQGSKLASVPFGISEASINSPFFVVASNEEDAERRNALIDRMTGTMFTINLSILTFLFAIAEPAIAFLLGDKWLAAVPVFRILLMAECLFCIKQFFMTLCKIHGRTAFIRNIGFCEFAVQLALLFAFYRFGILWIAGTQVAGLAFAVCCYIIYCSKSALGFGFRRFFRILLPTMWQPAVSLLVAFVVSLVLPTACPAFVQCVTIATAYATVTLGLGAATNSGLYALVRLKIGKR